MRKTYLLTPGPTQVPQEVSLASAQPLIHHRSQSFKPIFSKVHRGLKALFLTENPVILFTSSGTGAMEATVVSTLSRGDKVLVIEGGKFGQRWAEISHAYGLKVISLPVPWGEAVEPPRVEETLKKEPGIKAVFATLCETSTCVLTDIAALGSIVKETEALFIVDAVSGLGADELRVDDWAVDVAVSASQKALMCPPGLSFASVSQKALKAMQSSNLPTYYFSFQKALKALEKQENPFTPAISLYFGLNKALEMIEEEGLENVIARHGLMARAFRASCRAMGLELFSRAPSHVATAITLPPGIEGQPLQRKLEEAYGLRVTGGQDQLKGKIIRVAHLGYTGITDLLGAITVLELTLKEMGFNLPLGEGTRAALEVFTQKEAKI